MIQPKKKFSNSTLKTRFFSEELKFYFNFKERLEELNEKTKDILFQIEQESNVKRSTMFFNQELENQIKQFKNQIILIRSESHKIIDECVTQTNLFFQSYENKVDDLNERLILAEEGVQEAEQIKRGRDRMGSSKTIRTAIYKQFKKQQRQIADKKFTLKALLIREMVKSIQIMIQIMNQRKEMQQKKKNENQILKIIQYKKNGVGYQKMHQLELAQQFRQSKSLDKHFVKKPERMMRKHRKGSSFSLPMMLNLEFFKDYFKFAIKDTVNKIKDRNAQLTIENNLLSRAEEEKNKRYVLNKLKKKQSLQNEQRLVRLELEAQILKDEMDERILCAKLGKKSKQWPEISEKRRNDSEKMSLYKIDLFHDQEIKIKQQFLVNKEMYINESEPRTMES